MLELRMLGQINLRDQNGAELGGLLRQPKRLALLAYLSSPAPGAWHRRDMLLALFWPEMDAAHARTSLRNSLYVLRQFVGETVIRNRGDEEISVDPDSLRTDLSIVWEALRAGRIDDALAHYGGELLPGLFPPDSEGFQRWLDTERTRLKVAMTTAGMAYMDQLEREGSTSHALTIARRVCEINPDDETVVRRAMTLHEAVGDKAGGLAMFENYRSRLATDFEAEPAPETIAVANRLRSSTAPLVPKRFVRATTPPAVEEPHSFGPAVPTFGRRARRIAMIAAILVALLTLRGFVNLLGPKGPVPPTIGRSSPLTSEEGLQIEAAISPNGRLVAYAKGSSSSLRIFVQRIDGGAAWPLSGDSTHVELMPRWSPDNDEILYLSRNHAYVAPTLGGNPRIVARGGEGDAMIRSAAWSPAGDSIAIVRNDSLLVQPVRGSGSRFVGTGFQLHSCAWSPTNKWIACVSGNWIAFTPGPLFGNDAPSTVKLFPVSGGDAITLTNSDYESECPAWSADGKFLWMLSDRDGVPGEIYAVPIGDDGHASDKLVKVGGVRAESISLSGTRIAYSVLAKKANLWSVSIPRDTPASIAAATPITSGNQVIELVSTSRDGRWLVYDSNRHGNPDIYRMPIGGGEAESVTDDARQDFAPDLSPDGTEIAWQRFLGGVRHLFVKRLDNDSAIDILSVPGDHGVPRWSPDGRRIVAWSHNNERGGVFVLGRDIAGKWTRPLWRLDYGQLPVWSPDGEKIAFVTFDGRVQSIPADSGAVSNLYVPRPGTDDPHATFIRWSVNPNVIWMLGTTRSTQGLWSIAVDSGRPRLLVQLHDPISKSIGPGFATDESRFYFPLIERFSNVRWAELR